ncbi:hypothetical protein SBADM41S_12356 [Streptomyces badius]
MGEVAGLLARAAAQRQGLPVGGGGETGPPLVQEQHPELAQGPAEPGLRTDEPARAEAGAALQIDQPGQFLAGPGGGDRFPAVHLDLLAGGVAVVEGHGEEAVGEDDAGLPVTAHKNSCIRGAGRSGRKRQSST